MIAAAKDHFRKHPWPTAGWGAGERGVGWMTVVVFGLLGVTCLLGAVDILSGPGGTAASTGGDAQSRVGATGALLLAPLWLTMAATGFVVLVRRRRWSTRAVRPATGDGSGRAGMRIPYGRTRAGLVGFFVVAAVPAGIAVLVFVPRSGSSGYREAAMPLVGLVVLGAGLWFVLGVLRARGRRSRLILDGHGIDLRDGRQHTVVAWDAVRSVRPVLEGRAPTIVVEPHVMWSAAAPTPVVVPAGRLRPGGRSVHVSATATARPVRLRTPWLALDPVLTLEVIAFYAEHPDRRVELATDAALDRVRAWDVPPVPPTLQ